MSFKPAHALLAACLMLNAASVEADGSALTLPQALERARAVHPELAAFAFELRAQEGRARLAGIRPAPTVELLVEDAAGSGGRSGFDAAQTTLSLSQVIELGGKRGSRKALVDAEAGRLRTAHAVRQLDVVADIARRFVAVLAQQQRVEDAREGVALAQRVQAAVEQRVRAAASPEAELSRALVATAEAELALEDARHTLETARIDLAAAIGLRVPDFTSVSGALFTTPAAPGLDLLLAALEASPDFQRFADETRLREAELRLARSQRGPDLRATVGVRQFQQDDGTALLAGVSAPLFPSSRAAPALTTAQAEFDKVAFTREAALLKARALLQAHYQEMEHARHVMEALRDRVLPQLTRALEQTEYAWRRGRYSYLEWSDAQRRHLEARARYISVAAEFHTHRIEIERLAGQDMNPEEEGHE